jgi:hypothetical protein
LLLLLLLLLLLFVVVVVVGGGGCCCVGQGITAYHQDMGRPTGHTNAMMCCSCAAPVNRTGGKRYGCVVNFN